MIKTIQEAIWENGTKLYFVRDKKTNRDIFAIIVESVRDYHTIDDDNAEITIKDVDCSSMFYMEPWTKWAKATTPANENLFYDYVNKFENIRGWLKCTYEPKWKSALGEEFFDAVVKYIENDLYLFCCSFDDVCVYESLVDSDNDKRWIKE